MPDSRTYRPGLMPDEATILLVMESSAIALLSPQNLNADVPHLAQGLGDGSSAVLPAV